MSISEWWGGAVVVEGSLVSVYSKGWGGVLMKGILRRGHWGSWALRPVGSEQCTTL